MDTFVTSWNTLVSVSVVALDIALVAFIIVRFAPGLSYTKVESKIHDHRLIIVTVITTLAAIGSLVYSNIIGYEPCWLCWLQRIAIYPIAMLGITGLVRNEKSIIPYIKVLAWTGWVIALYHIFIYYTGYSPLPCDASATCTARYVYEFGFMTIPLMSFSVLSAVLVLLGARKGEKTV
jgi:disulfide bond formation protein DsbB